MIKKLPGMVLVGIVLATSSATEAKSKCDEAACADVKAQIREIQDRMRSGYTRAQGERYEARLRRLRDKRRRICR
ncbi:MAG: hypothetical protein QNJ00_00490 [Woeseiaceae bacterium]|nr:hypothetical protein [Woeseiaceae bacterium]